MGEGDKMGEHDCIPIVEGMVTLDDVTTVAIVIGCCTSVELLP